MPPASWAAFTLTVEIERVASKWHHADTPYWEYGVKILENEGWRGAYGGEIDAGDAVSTLRKWLEQRPEMAFFTEPDRQICEVSGSSSADRGRRANLHAHIGGCPIGYARSGSAQWLEAELGLRAARGREQLTARTYRALADPGSLHEQQARMVEQLEGRFPQAAMLADAGPEILAFTAQPKEHCHRDRRVVGQAARRRLAAGARR